MTWDRVVVGFAIFGAWCAVAFGAALTYLGCVEWATRHHTRKADKPIRNDDTILRLERSNKNWGK